VVTDGPDTSARDDASARLLANGQLPVVASQRLSQLGADSAFTSALSTDEFVALRVAGFDPVGQVMGTSVYHLGYLPYSCGYGGFGAGMGYVGAPTQSIGYYAAALHDARDRAVGRLVAECAALGGDGVVGVTVRRTPFPGAARTTEFSAVGTAVRARGGVRPPRPFTSDLSGQDVAKLLRAGYVPTSLAYGIAVAVRHDDWRTQSLSSRWMGNIEIPGYTELVGSVRHWARQDFAGVIARTGGENAVLRDTELEIWEQEPSDGHRDHFAIATVVGTGIAQFAAAPSAAPPLTMIRLH